MAKCHAALSKFPVGARQIRDSDGKVHAVPTLRLIFVPEGWVPKPRDQPLVMAGGNPYSPEGRCGSRET